MEKCSVCHKLKFVLTLNLSTDPINSDDAYFQLNWIGTHSGDSDYYEMDIYECEYFKYGADDTTLTSLGDTAPTEAGKYRIKVSFLGDDLFLPAEATADYTIAG